MTDQLIDLLLQALTAALLHAESQGATIQVKNRANYARTGQKPDVFSPLTVAEAVSRVDTGLGFEDVTLSSLGAFIGQVGDSQDAELLVDLSYHTADPDLRTDNVFHTYVVVTFN